MAKKRGRKKLPIDWESVGKMIMAGSNGAQVAASINVDYSTLTRRCEEDLNTNFTDFFNQKREAGNNLLFNKQFELAIKGDRSMLIWLGKNRLGQTDKRETTTVPQQDNRSEQEIRAEIDKLKTAINDEPYDVDADA